MILIRQRGPYDCAVAAVAMVAARAYEEALAVMEVRERGCGWFDPEHALFRLGFACQRVFSGPRESWPGRWPPRPWAPAHFGVLALPCGGHYVAVDAEGRIFDPAGRLSGRLSDLPPDQVHSVHGVWRAGCTPPL